MGIGFYSNCNEKYGIKFTDTNQFLTGNPNPIINVNVKEVKTPKDLVNAIIVQPEKYLNRYIKFTMDPADPTKLIMYDNRPGQQPKPDSGYGIVKPGC